MEIVTLCVNEEVKEKFFWLLQHFSEDEVQMMTDTNEEIISNLQNVAKEVKSGTLHTKTKTLGNLIDEL